MDHERRWRRAGFLLACAGLSLSPGCSDAGRDLDGRNVILIVVDSLRARELGCYGYDRGTSPFLDSLARRGILFESAVSTSSYTRESISSLFTGRLPSSGGAIGWRAKPREGPALAELFRDRGWATALFSNSLMIKKKPFRTGFDTVQFPGETQQSSGGGGLLTQVALDFINDRAPSDPFFLYLHYLDPHAPYEPADWSLSKFQETPCEEPLRLYGDVRETLTALRADGFGPGTKRFEDLKLRYDAELLQIDRAIHDLFIGLENAGILDRTLVIVTADHGEEFLEHGYVEHAWALYEESVHVPLILWGPSTLPTTCTPVGASLVDIMPTLASLFGFEPAATDGRPLLVADETGWSPVTDEVPRFSELMIQSRNVLHAVQSDGWKYIAIQKWLDHPEREEAVRRKDVGPVKSDDFEHTDVWGPPVREELYRLTDDPSERDNLADRLPDRLQAMRLLMKSYEARCPEFDAAAVDTSMISDEERRQLEALGYL